MMMSNRIVTGGEQRRCRCRMLLVSPELMADFLRDPVEPGMKAHGFPADGRIVSAFWHDPMSSIAPCREPDVRRGRRGGYTVSAGRVCKGAERWRRCKQAITNHLKFGGSRASGNKAIEERDRAVEAATKLVARVLGDTGRCEGCLKEIYWVRHRAAR